MPVEGWGWDSQSVSDGFNAAASGHEKPLKTSLQIHSDPAERFQQRTVQALGGGPLTLS